MIQPFPMPRQPWGQAQRPWGRPQVPVQQLQRFLQQGMPGTAVAHSYHVDALRQPEVRNDPSFQRFSDTELHELHHQVAALGSLMRLQMGDQNALSGLGYNLARFVARRQEALQTAQQFPAEVRDNPDVRRMMNLVRQSNRQLEQYWPAISQAVSAAGLGTLPRPQFGQM